MFASFEQFEGIYVNHDRPIRVDPHYGQCQIDIKSTQKGPVQFVKISSLWSVLKARQQS